MAVLDTPLRIGSAHVRNRLYRAPVLEGAGSGPDAAKLYARQFVGNARAGVGLIVQGNSCIYEEGRTSPGMTLVNTRERVLQLGEMVDAVRGEGAAVFLQIGHGGIYAMEGWHHPYASERKEPLLAASPLPLAIRPAWIAELTRSSRRQDQCAQSRCSKRDKPTSVQTMRIRFRHD